MLLWVNCFKRWAASKCLQSLIVEIIISSSLFSKGCSISQSLPELVLVSHRRRAAYQQSWFDGWLYLLCKLFNTPRIIFSICRSPSLKDFPCVLALSITFAFLLFAFRLMRAVDNEVLSLIFKFNLSNPSWMLNIKMHTKICEIYESFISQ